MKTYLKNGQTLLFIGDSITDCDRANPAVSRLGWGYVRMFADLLSVREPEKQISVINKGINGNTVAHLLSRWCDDVIENNPDVLVILVGINDVTRYLEQSRSLHHAPQEFAAIYRQIIAVTRQRLPNCRMYLMEPFFVSKGDDIPGSYRKELISILEDYIKSVRDIAVECQCGLVRLSEVFRELLIHRNSADFSEDKIHPNQTGHFAIAEAVYRCLATGDQPNV